ncbi:uncharacterized protein [Littorina saxatilis]|uniref:uncharacterized protein n=1 Tax=Littorina saxatilis TaxID=31220 RepID=UPI0038B521CA
MRVARRMRRAVLAVSVIGLLCVLCRMSLIGMSDKGAGDPPCLSSVAVTSVARAATTWNTTPAAVNTKSALPKVVKITEERKSRAEQLQQTCAELREDQRSSAYVTAFRTGGQYLVDNAHSLLYCPIEKVGSSFWKRVFAILTKDGHVQHNASRSVFDHSGVAVHRLRGAAKLWAKDLLTSKLSFHNFTKFVFVRDPYERLFSGFIDKLFTPTFETLIMSRDVLLSSTKTLKGIHGQFRQAKHNEANQYTMAQPDREERLSARSGDHDSEITAPEEGVASYLGRGNMQYGFEERGPVFRLEDIHKTDSEIQDDDEHSFRIHRREQLIRERQKKKMFRDDTNSPYHMHVSFEQFVHHVIGGVRVNEHFLPMSTRCPPCFFRYDVIGRMKTFKDDVNFILNSAGVDPEDVIGSDSSFDHDSDANILRDVTLRTFSVMRKYQLHMTRWEMLRRTWVAFQIRGFLSTQRHFPLTSQQANVITEQDFIHLVNQAYAQSGPREIRMHQRKAAMLEAYYDLPRNLLNKLEAYVDLDCKLFGYDCSVESRFNLKDRPTHVFHFNDLLGDLTR